MSTITKYDWVESTLNQYEAYIAGLKARVDAFERIGQHCYEMHLPKALFGVSEALRRFRDSVRMVPDNIDSIDRGRGSRRFRALGDTYCELYKRIGRVVSNMVHNANNGCKGRQKDCLEITVDDEARRSIDKALYRSLNRLKRFGDSFYHHGPDCNFLVNFDDNGKLYIDMYCDEKSDYKQGPEGCEWVTKPINRISRMYIESNENYILWLYSKHTFTSRWFGPAGYLRKEVDTWAFKRQQANNS